MNLPGFDRVIRLPTPATDNIDARQAMRLGVDLLMGRKTLRDVAFKAGAEALYQGIDEMTGGLAGDLVEHEVQILKEATRELEQVWLPTLKYALIAVQGDPGEGKSTVVGYLMDSYFYGKKRHWIGVPQALLPPGHRELSNYRLAELGVAIKAAAKEHIDPKELVAAFLGTDWALAVDDASLYLAAGSSDKPENIAVRNIIDLRRHLNGVVIVNFQTFAGADQKFTKADLYLLKQASPATSGGDRPEILRMRKMANDYFAAFNAMWRTKGADRKEIKARRVLKAWAVCPEIELLGPWTHGRPPWYGEAFSRNAAFTAPGMDPDVLDAEYKVTEE